VRRVLLLATTTGYQTRAFGEAAERLGVGLTFATDRCHVLEDPWRDEAIPIRFYDEEASVAAILESTTTRSLDGVLVVGDRPAAIGARVQQALGLPGHPAAAARAAGNKRATRARLREAGLPGPTFFETRLDVDPRRLAGRVPFPCVVKPLALSGSRGVIRADDERQFVAAFDRLRALLRSTELRAERNPAHERALIESFVPGREYALEGVLEHGALRTLAIFDKPDPLDGPFFEETIYVTPSMTATGTERAIVTGVERAAEALGLAHGPIHAECRLNDRGVFVLEVAARPIGGLCARALRFVDVRTTQSDSPIAFEELLLRHALGESLAGWAREPAASGVMMIPIPRRGILRRVDGVDLARQVTGIVDVRITAKPDQQLVPLPEGASYLGFIFARTATPAAAERALRDAHGCLGLAIDAELPVIAGR
jgi:ATP-grasp domain-containing protein/L-aminoacid ligase-like protein